MTKPKTDSTAILDHTQVLLAHLDTEFNFVHVNRAYAQRCEREAPFFEGKNYFQLEADAGMEKVFRRVAATGEPHFARGGLLPGACNSKRDVTLWDWSLVPVKDKGGATIGLVLTVVDVTEKRQADEELTLIREQWEMTFDAVPDLIMLLDHRHRIIRANKAMGRRLRVNPKELVGRACYEVVHGTDAPPVFCPHVRLLTDGREHSVETSEGRIGGTFLVTVSPLGNKKAGAPGCVHVARDITVLKETERQLTRAKEATEQANRAKTEFLASMSHELRTPLNHILGFTELVVDKRFGDLNETQAEYLTNVLESSRHLLSLVTDILDLSKVEAGKTELNMAEVSLRQLVQGCLIMVRERGAKHGIRLVASLDSLPETIRADGRKLKHILFHLVSNAVSFTPDGGQVHVSARMIDCTVRPGLRKGDPEDFRVVEAPAQGYPNGDVPIRKCAEFLVADTGMGIRKEDLERIFKPFEQGRHPGTLGHHGTGLGLSIARRLVELHGGRIWAESEGEGRGATVRFVIPLL